MLSVLWISVMQIEFSVTHSSPISSLKRLLLKIKSDQTKLNWKIINKCVRYTTHLL